METELRTCNLCRKAKHVDKFPSHGIATPKRCTECQEWKRVQWAATARYRRTGVLPPEDLQPRDFSHYSNLIEEAAVAFGADVEYLIRIAKDAPR